MAELSKDYFFNKIKNGYTKYKERYENFTEIEYMGDILGLTTYDENLTLMFCFDAAMTIDAIINNKQSELMSDDLRYKNYIMMLNIEFFDCLDWGSSIRYCWFDAFSGMPYNAFEILSEDDIIPIDVITDQTSIKNFFNAFLYYFLYVITNYKDDNFSNEKSLLHWNNRYK